MKIKGTNTNRKKLLIAAIILVIIVGGVVFAYVARIGPFANLSDSINKEKYGSADTEPTAELPKGTNSDEKSSNPDGTTSSKDTTGTSVVQPNDSLAASEIVTPLGTFVSNHEPNLSGSPAPNLIVSTCRTSPGVSCTITFTQNGITKSLPMKITDSNGNADWTWKLQDIGLTAGDWKIAAVAKSGNATKTADDVMVLKVRN